jgi:hypothetical protein
MSRAISSLESVQNYIAGRMTDVGRRDFENQLIDDPSLLRELETSLRLREGLELLRDRHKLPTQTASRWRSAMLGIGAAGAAASMLLIVYLGLRHARPSSPVMAASLAVMHERTTAPLSVSERYTFAKLRGGGEPGILGLPADGALELRALTSITDASQTFGISLDRIESQRTVRIGAVGHLTPDAEGFVVIYVDASNLKPADYLLNVESEADKTTAERFAFTLKPRAQMPVN